MRLTQILQPDCVVVPLTGTDKHAVIDELVDRMVAKTSVGPADQLKAAVWQREQTRTTGIGHGIAIPHGKAACVDQLRMAVGLCPEPVDFNAIDRKPVKLVVLLASPADQTGPHIQALGRISRMLVDEQTRDAIKSAPDAKTLYDLIATHDTPTPA
jgi:fructose-specific phosphotransferase system IIA component